MQSFAPLCLVACLLVAGAFADGLFPPGITFINADDIAIEVLYGQAPPVILNGSLGYVASKEEGLPNVLRVSIGETYTSWTLITVKPGGSIDAVAYGRLPNGTCVKSAPATGLLLSCNKWTPSTGPGTKTTWTTTCTVKHSGGTALSFLTVVTDKNMLLSYNSRSDTPKAPETTITVRHQFNTPPSPKIMQPCTPTSPAVNANTDAASLLEFASPADFSFGGVFNAVKCGACKLGVGAIVGKLCGSAGVAACAAFPPAIPFCGLLAQAACKTGGTISKDTACKVIHMC